MKIPHSILGMLNHVESELVSFAGVFLNRVQRELPHLQQETLERQPRTPRL